MAIAPGTTLVDYIVPARSSRVSNLIKDVLLIVGFSLFLALCAQVSFYLPSDPLVPVTLQTLGVLLIGATLGKTRGTLAVLAYLAEGAAGLPFFAKGAAGLSPFIGATAGFLLAFPIAAFVVGLLCEYGFDRSYWKTIIAMLVGTVIIYALGVSWLAYILHGNVVKAIQFGMVPFIPGDILKLLVATALLPTAWYIVRRVKPESTPK